MPSPQDMASPLLYPHHVSGGAREMELQPSQMMSTPLIVQQASAPVASEPVAAPMGPAVVAQLQIAVATGCQAGQTLQFTPPGQTQPMSVVMQQEVLPGSTVVVQYPMHQQTPQQQPVQQQPVQQQPVQQQPAQQVQVQVQQQQQQHQQQQQQQPQPQAVHVMMQQGSLPPTQLQLAEEDGRVHSKGWLLYAAGCVCCFCFSPMCGPPLWIAACALYFCKPAEQRARLPRSRVPALTALITCVAAACCAMIFALVFVAMMMGCADKGEMTDWGNCVDGQFDFNMHHGHHHKHNDWHHHDHSAIYPPGPPPPHHPDWIDDDGPRHDSGKFFEVEYPQTGGVDYVKKPSIPRAAFAESHSVMQWQLPTAGTAAAGAAAAGAAATASDAVHV